MFDNSLDPDGELPTILDFPIYKQLYNACGPTTLLILLNPEQNPPVKRFLTSLSGIIDPLIPDVDQNNHSARFQYALEYLLLKTQGTGSKNNLYQYFLTHFYTVYEDQKAVNNFQLENHKERYLELNQISVVKLYDEYILGVNDLLSRQMLKDAVHTMKTDIELKMLMDFFGFRFLTFNCCDITGALDFAPNNADKTVGLLIESLINPDRRMLYGSNNHWMPITGIMAKNSKLWRLKNGKVPKIPLKYLQLHCLDPMIADSKILDGKDLDSQSRVYIFEDRKENFQRLWDEFLTQVKVDIKTEIERQKRLDAEYHEEPSAINLDIQNLLEGLGKPITHSPSKIASQSIDNSESNDETGWGDQSSDVSEAFSDYFY